MVVNLTPSMVRSLRDLTSNPIPLLRSIRPRLTDQRFPNTHALISELLRVPLAHSLMFIVQLLLALTFLRRVIIVPISRLPRLLLEVATKDIVPSTPDLMAMAAMARDVDLLDQSIATEDIVLLLRRISATLMLESPVLKVLASHTRSKINISMMSRRRRVSVASANLEIVMATALLISTRTEFMIKTILTIRLISRPKITTTSETLIRTEFTTQMNPPTNQVSRVLTKIRSMTKIFPSTLALSVVFIPPSTVVATLAPTAATAVRDTLPADANLATAMPTVHLATILATDLDLDVVTSTPMRTTVSRDTPAPTTALMV